MMKCSQHWLVFLPHILTNFYDAHGRLARRIEFVNPLTVSTLADLYSKDVESVIASIVKDSLKDRSYIKKYNLRGDDLGEFLQNAKGQVVMQDVKSIPAIVDTAPQEIGIENIISPTGKLIGIKAGLAAILWQRPHCR